MIRATVLHGSGLFNTELGRSLQRQPWSRTVEVELQWDGEEELEIVIRDEESFKAYDKVGSCSVNVSAVARLGSFSGQLQVFRRGTVASGLLHVSISCEAVQVLGPALLVQAIPAKLHRNHFAGVVQSVQDGDSLSAFITYQVVLQQVLETFGEAQNANWAGKHAMIFADTPQGALIRTAIHSELSALYGDGLLPHWLCMSGKRYEKYSLSSGACLLSLIRLGVRDGRRRVFTYALLDHGWFFSETGACMSKDVLSKHAVHANASRLSALLAHFVFVRMHLDALSW
ncbi:unnamed protein product [Polarella glacialis]|uniref:Uncharacterized protein n=1 Tax=Polarella glacialis TaxID=89957 RepID=A0A813I312_POLGL|nr:unnamed protein product [Polarella glacialis]